MRFIQNSTFIIQNCGLPRYELFIGLTLGIILKALKDFKMIKQLRLPHKVLIFINFEQLIKEEK
ncbi:MAG: hypothetical protein AUK34_00755 [Ignavibacteria bacterium CG2_30_36_16]|nr:MAG: hypothetical protein AUK34_00755 [Ignavibacteria bacterium CG2_30_36_16]PJB01628.1 MAG: hypothetical protein CO127_02770 [Ignavibacteria bacterium CG_4_9_14_3_um_filter_36_18]